jgi:pyruvate-formate lyase-activating enzyme
LKVTGNCEGSCPYCYMSSEPGEHYKDIVQKVRDFFGPMTLNQRPFQVALGGGEPTSHPDFINLLRVLKEELDICPNYTTNGMWIKRPKISEYGGLSFSERKILVATEKYCGGVAVSCHPHLKDYWSNAAFFYSGNNVKLNFHIIISDKESIDYFCDIYKEWSEIIDYFVLLPYGSQGRAKKKEIDWEYLIHRLPDDQSKLAFGANFYPYLLKGGHNIKVNLYEPEIMSKFLDLKDMKLYPSSFNLIEKQS